MTDEEVEQADYWQRVYLMRWWGCDNEYIEKIMNWKWIEVPFKYDIVFLEGGVRIMTKDIVIGSDLWKSAIGKNPSVGDVQLAAEVLEERVAELMMGFYIDTGLRVGELVVSHNYYEDHYRETVNESVAKVFSASCHVVVEI